MSIPENANLKKNTFTIHVSQKQLFFKFYHQEMRKANQLYIYIYIYIHTHTHSHTYIYSYTDIYIIYSTFLCIAMIFGHGLK